MNVNRVYITDFQHFTPVPRGTFSPSFFNPGSAGERSPFGRKYFCRPGPQGRSATGLRVLRSGALVLGGAPPPACGFSAPQLPCSEGLRPWPDKPAAAPPLPALGAAPLRPLRPQAPPPPPRESPSAPPPPAAGSAAPGGLPPAPPPSLRYATGRRPLF